MFREPGIHKLIHMSKELIFFNGPSQNDLVILCCLEPTDYNAPPQSYHSLLYCELYPQCQLCLAVKHELA